MTVSQTMIVDSAGIAAEGIPELQGSDREARALVRRAVADQRRGGVHAEGIAAGSRPGRIGERSALVARECNADVVVVGSSQRSAFSRLLTGNVSRQTADRAPCAIMIVRRPVGAPSEKNSSRSETEAEA